MLYESAQSHLVARERAGLAMAARPPATEKEGSRSIAGG